MYAAQAHVCGTRVRGTRVRGTRVRGTQVRGTWVQDMTRANVKIKREEKNGALYVYYPPAILCCFSLVVCKQCIRM